MDHLTDYLRGPFISELDELHKVRQTADDALATLDRYNTNAQWPYELAQDERWTPKASHSTSAMIMFSMGVAVGNIRASVLCPTVSWRNQEDMFPEVRDLHRKVQSEYKSNLLKFRRYIESDRGPKNKFEVSQSTTYGPDDPFTLLWILEILRPNRRVDPELSRWYEKVVTCAAKRVDDVFRNPGDPRKAMSSDEVVEHLFPTLRVVQLYKHLCGDPAFKPTTSHSQLEEYLRNRLHLHLSYFSIPNSSYDAAELAFSMEGILLLDPDALDSATVDRCREVIAESQNRTPYWRPLRPFIASTQGRILLPLSVEIANSLLRSCEILENRDRSQSHVSRNVGLFRKYTEWLFTRKIKGRVKNQTEFMGWHSEHADDPRKIHPWETSQVQIYLLHYESFLRRHRATTSLGLMGLRLKPSSRTGQKPLDTWSDVKEGTLQREPMRALSDTSEYSVFHRIGDSYIKPRNDGWPSAEAHYSMLLFGPQGTGKTSLAEKIAECLGQPLISISPSDFTVGGGALVEARAQAIFDVLGAQTGAVILLDEIDRLILDRDSEMYQKQSDLFQFMTPGMLTKFVNLRRSERCIFIVSTNYAERIDPAIKRAGRIDDQYVVMPPDKSQRARIILSQLQAVKPNDTPSESELEEVVRGSVFFIPGELQRIARRAAPAAKGSRAKALLLNALKEEMAKIEPTIRLSAYRARFRWGNEPIKASQEPYTEFLLLMYLLFESQRALTPAERGLWKDCIDHLGKDGDLRSELSVYLKDEAVLKALMAASAL